MTPLNQLQYYAAPLGRVLLSVMFISSGLQKLFGYAGTQQYMEYMGVPGALLPLVILTEVGGGLALLLGWKARLAAFLLAGFALLSGLLFHLVPSFALEGMEAQTQMIGFWKNVSIAGGMLMVTAFGAGPLSIDRSPEIPAK
ncbi:DoxX family protein [Pseudooceanicola sediminis]|uniref:DoxX family protein n=1 Tax=Pseudooceanicola sediminis TaxID=2211117 RepID=A0A399IZY1_9RHOB|nr:DoxX family protein [Pseudooceanicola sediminis]RII37967.1 DoxX family protein [Pseudooceanicola sediminis]|tara:strand:+ start:20356 stop:20781 length:426 start_codon:yes stop_codon:yes gene_type:complete